MTKVNGPATPVEDADIVDAELSHAIADGRVAEAARTAIERQKASGMGITFLRGDIIVTQYPDGREEILATLARWPEWTPRHTLAPKDT